MPCAGRPVSAAHRGVVFLCCALLVCAIVRGALHAGRDADALLHKSSDTIAGGLLLKKSIHQAGHRHTDDTQGQWESNSALRSVSSTDTESVNLAQHTSMPDGASPSDEVSRWTHDWLFWADDDHAEECQRVFGDVECALRSFKKAHKDTYSEQHTSGSPGDAADKARLWCSPRSTTDLSPALAAPPAAISLSEEHSRLAAALHSLKPDRVPQWLRVASGLPCSFASASAGRAAMRGLCAQLRSCVPAANAAGDIDRPYYSSAQPVKAAQRDDAGCASDTDCTASSTDDDGTTGLSVSPRSDSSTESGANGVFDLDKCCGPETDIADCLAHLRVDGAKSVAQMCDRGKGVRTACTTAFRPCCPRAGRRLERSTEDLAQAGTSPAPGLYLVLGVLARTDCADARVVDVHRGDGARIVQVLDGCGLESAAVDPRALLDAVRSGSAPRVRTALRPGRRGGALVDVQTYAAAMASAPATVAGVLLSAAGGARPAMRVLHFALLQRLDSATHTAILDAALDLEVEHYAAEAHARACASFVSLAGGDCAPRVAHSAPSGAPRCMLVPGQRKAGAACGHGRAAGHVSADVLRPTAVHAWPATTA